VRKKTRTGVTLGSLQKKRISKMRLQVGKKQVDVEYQVIVLALACLAWSLHYYWSTVRIPYDGKESVLFIKPLLIILALSTPFVIKSAIKIVPEDAEKEKEQGPGIFHSRRLVFALSLFVYAAALPFLGYLIPSIVYLVVMCLYMGLRNIYIFIGVLAGYSLLLWVGFKQLLGVPIPILPGF
jgi:hypothetical protein